MPGNQHLDAKALSQPSRKQVVLLPGAPFSNCKKYWNRKRDSATVVPGEIIFLRGQLSDRWLGVMGSKHGVDPGFLSQCLDFGMSGSRANHFSVPGFCTTNWNMVRLPLITLGLRDTMHDVIDQKELRRLRQKVKEQLNDYHAEVNSLEQKNRVGSSLVRDYHIFDQNEFAIEQSISVCFQPGKNACGWTCKSPMQSLIAFSLYMQVSCGWKVGRSTSKIQWCKGRGRNYLGH